MTSPAPAVAAGELSDAAKMALVRMVAGADSLWRPWRRTNEPAFILHAREEMAYAAAGLPWRPEARTEAEAKAAERALTALVVRKLVRRVRGLTKTTHVIVTPDGDTLARRLAGRPGPDQAAELCVRLGRLGAEIGVAWIPETLIACPAVEWNGTDFRHLLTLVEFVAAPAIARGWVEACPDGHGRIYYKLTAEGANVRPAARWPGERMLHCPAGEIAGVDAVFNDTWRAARLVLSETKVQPGGELGRLPLPVCGWTVKGAERYRAALAKYSQPGVSP